MNPNANFQVQRSISSFNYQNNGTDFLKKSQPESAIKKYHQKMKQLSKVNYLNPVARLDYEDKLTEMHTKYSNRAQQTINKKLRAKNQMAEFQNEQDDQDIFDQLMDYKHGSRKNINSNFHYEQTISEKQYKFCPNCDLIYANSITMHQLDCNCLESTKLPNYYSESLQRLELQLNRLMCHEAQELLQIISGIKKSENVKRRLSDISQLVQHDPVLGGIAKKIEKILQAEQD